MSDSSDALLTEIEAYCRVAGIAESTFGRQAVNDGKLCLRLRAGRNVTIETAQRLRDYIRLHSSQADSSVITPGNEANRSGSKGDKKMKHNVTDDRPFRFYDNRQKYLAFVNTCNEKWRVAERATQELAHLRPSPPALRLFDAGVGDSTVLSHLMRAMHRRFPTIPFFIVGKEVSLEDVRLTLEKLPDRFIEHPSSVIIITNLYYAEAPWLMPNDVAKAAALNWLEVPLQGDSAHEFGEQLRGMDKELVDGWQVKANEKSGNPMYVRPSVMVLFREDHRILLDDVIPKRGQAAGGDYDLVLASQPWRARMSADFKVKHVLAPLAKSLRPGGRLLTAQSCGNDPGLELVRKIWPDEDPFTVDRHELIKTLKEYLGRSAQKYNFNAGSDAKSLLRYHMHTLPTEIGEAIGTSTLFAAWNAAIYVGQIEDERLEPVVSSGDYLDATADVLHKHNGIWFNDETFVVSRKRDT
jgi:hypothetical protein